MLRVLAAASALLFAVAASAAEVRVFAAASLADALTEVAAAYERQSGDRVLLNLGASSTLARQIELGAPADVFISADEARMDALLRLGLIDAATRASVLSNALAVVVPSDRTVPIAVPRDLTRARSIALADPSAVPAGIYAREWLQQIGLWSALVPKIVPTDNVRAALAAVEAGNVDAAIVYATDARIAKRVRVAFVVPRGSGPAIAYPSAVVSTTRQAGAARRFLAFSRSEAALRVFARHGFIVR